MFQRIRDAAAHVGFLVAALFAVSASAAQSADKPTVVRFGVSTAGVGNPPRVSTGWVSVAQRDRYIERELEKDGIEVQWIFFKGQGPAVNEAISNNQLDFTTLGDLPSIIGRSVGLDTRLVLVTGSRSEVYAAARPGSGIRSIADLRGKRVAFNKGTASQLAVNRILAAKGLSEKDIRVVNMEPASYKAAFLAGDVDVIFGSLDLINLRDQSKAEIIYDSKKDPVATSSGHVLVNQKFAAAYPQITQRVVTALVRAAHWSSLDQNRDEVFKLWGSAGSVPEATYRREYEGIPLAQRLSPIFDDFIVAQDKRGVADAYKYKLIRRTFDVDAWIDRRYVDAALKQLQLETFWPRFDAQARLLAQR
ncbi:ABC transporter substrate-binding protein [Niveibacterium sp. SC-1]|uniref:ABC transporter substrate-binding protein n=1 Tax=Niveibacterium sp. SC-1 TaxID=3135646 RepID=UPI00311E5773